MRCLKLLLEATDREADQDWAGAIAALRTALGSGMAAEDRDVWANLGNMALLLGDDAAHRSFFGRMLAAARTDGAVMEVLYALHRLCFSQYAAGDWSAVRRSADEALSLARSIGQPAQTGTPLAWLTLLAALQGRNDYDDLLDRATRLLAAHRLGVMDGFVADVLRWARAVRAAQAGDAAESLHHFAQMHDGVLARLAATPRITAAVQAADAVRARAWTEEMERFAAAARCRGRRRWPNWAVHCSGTGRGGCVFEARRALRVRAPSPRRGAVPSLEPRSAVRVQARQRPGDPRLGRGRPGHEGRRAAQAHDPIRDGLWRERSGRRRDQAPRALVFVVDLLAVD